MPITKNRIRIQADNVLSRGAQLTDVLISGPARMWQSEDVEVELGIFQNGTILDSATNLASVTCEVKDPNNLIGSPLLNQVQSTINIITLGTWQANGSGSANCNALFTFTAAQTNVALGGAQNKTLNMYFYALDTSGTPQRFPLGWGQLSLQDSGFGDVGAITVVPPGARMKNNRLQIQCIDDNLYYDTIYRHVTIGGQSTLALSSIGPGQA